MIIAKNIFANINIDIMLIDINRISVNVGEMLLPWFKKSYEIWLIILI